MARDPIDEAADSIATFMLYNPDMPEVQVHLALQVICADLTPYESDRALVLANERVKSLIERARDLRRTVVRELIHVEDPPTKARH